VICFCGNPTIKKAVGLAHKVRQNEGVMIFFWVGICLADTLTVNLSQRSTGNYTDSTALLDFVRSKVVVPYAAGGSSTKLLDFGDARDGAFEDGPAQTGISISGNTITFDTDSKSLFRFSQFTLSAGKTVQVSGSAALRIYVLGAVDISSSISAIGSNGTANSTGTTGTKAGGSGVAGGGTGGLGAAGATVASAGTPTSGDTKGGTAGTLSNTTLSYDGGGGGCTGTGPDAGNNATTGLNPGSGDPNNQAVCARTRTAISADFDTSFTTLAGGGGGGGGGSYNSGTGVTGSGGGGGGGRIQIRSLDSIQLNSGSSISAKGGNGGNINSSQTL
jgi:hypothetical protein